MLFYPIIPHLKFIKRSALGYAYKLILISIFSRVNLFSLYIHLIPTTTDYVVDVFSDVKVILYWFQMREH